MIDAREQPHDRSQPQLITWPSDGATVRMQTEVAATGSGVAHEIDHGSHTRRCDLTDRRAVNQDQDWTVGAGLRDGGAQFHHRTRVKSTYLRVQLEAKGRRRGARRSLKDGEDGGAGLSCG